MRRRGYVPAAEYVQPKPEGGDDKAKNAKGAK
jgi:hypothetical protein